MIAARERELGVPVTLDNLGGLRLGAAVPRRLRCGSFMLGFLGFPLTGGFSAKFYAFAAAYRHGWWWLIVVGVAGTIVSAAYYLAVVRAMYLRDTRRAAAAPPAGGLAAARPARSPPASASASRSRSGSFFAVQPLIDVARSAADALPF